MLLRRVLTMRERLIELIQDSVNGCARHWAEVIADYLIDNGVVVLPCKVGTRVYMVLDRYDARKLGCSCCLAEYGFETECAYYKSGDCTNMTANANWQIVSRRFEYQHINDFGKTVFLSREEAERALKGGAK
jgi:hypothetical protein